MKTYVRIQRGKNGNYDNLTMQILHPSTYRQMFVPVATISWQGDPKYQWYGMRFFVDTELHNHNHLLIAYKLAAYIKERVANETPDEVMAIIGGIECFYEHGMFIPITESSKQVYYLRASKTGSVNTMIISANENTAQRAIEGLIKRKEITDNGTWVAEPTGKRLSFHPTSLTY